MIVTLLTDFGVADEYVGVLKGVMLGINPKLTLIDISHQVPPQDIVAAGNMLRSAYPHFPEGTLHVAVVDPGVGSERAILAARLGHYLFMAPDNGLLPLVWGSNTPDKMFRVENKALFRQPVSPTFHGRDIFAPVAAYLSKGNDLEKVGPPATLDQIHRLDIKAAVLDASGEWVGEIVRIDRFGNLITNIGSDDLKHWVANTPLADIEIRVGDHTIKGVAQTYAQGTCQKPMALVGSHNCIEIALTNGSAANWLGVGLGSQVRIKT